MTKQEIKKTIQRILADTEKGIIPSLRDQQDIINYWIAYIADTSYSYPYSTTIDKIGDIIKLRFRDYVR